MSDLDDRLYVIICRRWLREPSSTAVELAYASPIIWSSIDGYAVQCGSAHWTVYHTLCDRNLGLGRQWHTDARILACGSSLIGSAFAAPALSLSISEYRRVVPTCWLRASRYGSAALRISQYPGMKSENSALCSAERGGGVAVCLDNLHMFAPVAPHS